MQFVMFSLHVDTGGQTWLTVRQFSGAGACPRLALKVCESPHAVLSPAHHPVTPHSSGGRDWRVFFERGGDSEWLPGLSPGVSQPKTRNFSTTSRRVRRCAGERGVQAVAHGVGPWGR